MTTFWTPSDGSKNEKKMGSIWTPSCDTCQNILPSKPVHKWPILSKKRVFLIKKGYQKVIKKWPKMVIFGVTPKTPKLRKSRFCDFCAFRVKKCQLEPKNPKKPHSYAKKRGQKWPQNGSKNDPFLDPLYTGFRGQKRGKTAQNGSKKGSKKWPKMGPKWLIMTPF